MSRSAVKAALITGRPRASGRRSPTDWPLPGHRPRSLTPATGAAPKVWQRDHRFRRGRRWIAIPRKKTSTKEIQMNTSSNLLVLGATGQAGNLVAKNFRRSDAHFSVGTRRKANLEELAHQFGASRFIDLDDPRTFDEALKDITGLFLLTGYTVDMLVLYWFSLIWKNRR